MSIHQRIFKRLMDIIISMLGLVVLAPFFPLMALLIKLDSKGPAFFRQSRMGKDGKPFICYKLRTMYLNAPDTRNPDGSTFSADDDPRVTQLGRFLRKSSLDELPQLLNVFKGDMSLVGPRPDPVDALSLYREQDKARLMVKPGITGWAAIHGRNATPWHVRRDLDLEYVSNCSLWLDIEILARTVPYVWAHKGVFAKNPDDSDQNLVEEE